ncbi:MAG: type II toxin-antitoxin system VapC family toxin [Bryobacterales bacterium]|nr:type II toxin-antitoxin system VapC family toxin [Bryobacterales bacterium]
MRYLLDTNAVIALLNRRSDVLLKRVLREEPREVGLSVIVYHELYFGAFKSQRAAGNLDLVDRLAFEAVEFTKEDAREAGEIRAYLAKAGTPIGPLDVLIAAQAKLRGVVLVTANTSEFARVSGLRIENWMG